MRYVVVTGKPPDTWLEKAEELTKQLKNATSEKEREEIIEKNEKHWKDNIFRDWLISQFKGKCWYSEAQESVSSYHVDHFRPKGRVTNLDKSCREGYWWLAFKWDNYRISGELLNVKKRDWFPISYGSYAQPFDKNSLEIEAYVLLDPCVEEEAALISFNDAGEATAAEDIDEADEWRVEKTIDILGLNRLGRLVSKRCNKWNECLLEILEYTNASDKHQALKAIQRALAVKKLKKMVKYEEEFSSVALACIRKTAPESLFKQIIAAIDRDRLADTPRA
jgi:hypothetical protein